MYTILMTSLDDVIDQNQQYNRPKGSTIDVQVSAEVSDFMCEDLLISPSLATLNYRSSIATIDRFQIGITTSFINSLASSPMDK